MQHCNGTAWCYVCPRSYSAEVSKGVLGSLKSQHGFYLLDSISLSGTQVFENFNCFHYDRISSTSGPDRSFPNKREDQKTRRHEHS